MSDDAKTPRLTATFEVWKEVARLLAQDLQVVETTHARNLEKLDADIRDLARAMRILALEYSKTFANWPKCSRSTTRKSRERDSFEKFRDSAIQFIESHQ